LFPALKQRKLRNIVERRQLEEASKGEVRPAPPPKRLEP
jgi:hypothetical protein